MRTAQLKLGPTDHGRRLTLDDFDAAEREPGAKYEIINGRVYVSAFPSLAENRIETWLYGKLCAFQDTTWGVLNYLTCKGRVFVQARRATAAKPDITAYADFPHEFRLGDIHWKDLAPLLVCEILVDGDPEKDLERNVDLYLAVPSIREYWVIDAWDDPERPTLIQHRRHGKRWVVRRFEYGTTFTTKLLPGFSLLIDPRK